jgi:hypothetical protein
MKFCTRETKDDNWQVCIRWFCKNKGAKPKSKDKSEKEKKEYVNTTTLPITESAITHSFFPKHINKTKQ